MGCSITQCGVVTQFAKLVYHDPLGWQVERAGLTGGSTAESTTAPRGTVDDFPRFYGPPPRGGR